MVRMILLTAMSLCSQLAFADQDENVSRYRCEVSASEKHLGYVSVDVRDHEDNDQYHSENYDVYLSNRYEKVVLTVFRNDRRVVVHEKRLVDAHMEEPIQVVFADGVIKVRCEAI